MRELRLFSGHNILFEKVKDFIENCTLFTMQVDLKDVNTLRNLSEVDNISCIKTAFKQGINSLIVQDSGDAEIKDTSK